jgi:hypothetical protein
MAPSMILLVPIASSIDFVKSRLLTSALVALSVTYTFCVMGAWAVAVFYLFPRHINTQDAIIPMLIWSYCSATSVWSFFALRDARSGDDPMPLSILFDQIGCVALML